MSSDLKPGFSSFQLMIMAFSFMK